MTRTLPQREARRVSIELFDEKNTNPHKFMLPRRLNLTASSTIELLEPADGASTAPLQYFPVEYSGDTWKTFPSTGVLSETFSDRTQPRPVQFSWTVDDNLKNSRSLKYDLLIAHTPSFESPLYLSSLTGSVVDVYHLYVGEQYYWRVIAYRRRRIAAESAIAKFRTNALMPRWICVPELTNVRDIGGWRTHEGYARVRQGLLYRGCDMEDLTPAGATVLQQQLQIRTVLDLRKREEGAAPTLLSAAWVHRPVSPYARIVDNDCRSEYRKIFKLMADESNYPIFLHCLHGADRTGTVAFLLGALLGISTEDLALDFELSSLSRCGPRNRKMVEYQQLQAVLNYYRKRDTDSTQDLVAAYLQDIGVKSKEIANIRKIFLLPPLQNSIYSEASTAH